MPTPPKDNETREQFISRCMSVMHGEGKYPKDQQAAICISMWNRKKKSAKAESKEKADGKEK